MIWWSSHLQKELFKIMKHNRSNLKIPAMEVYAKYEIMKQIPM